MSRIASRPARERSALELDAEPGGQPIDIVEIGDDADEVVDAAVAEVLRAKRREISFGDRGGRARQLERELDHGARPRAQGRRLRIRRERVDQRLIVRQPPKRRPMVLHSIEAVVGAGHADSDRLALRPRELGTREHDLFVQLDVREHHFRVDAVDADDVRDATAPLAHDLVRPLEGGICFF